MREVGCIVGEENQEGKGLGKWGRDRNGSEVKGKEAVKVELKK